MKRITLFTIGALVASGLSAQQTAQLKGHVLDARNRQGLPFATVRLQDTQKKIFGAVSQNNGAYSFAGIPQGRYTLIVSYIGYNTLRKEITLKAGENAYPVLVTERSEERRVGKDCISRW